MAAGWSVLGNCYTTSEQVINAFTGLQAFWASSSNWWFQPVNISFNQSTSTVSFDMRNDQGGLLTGKTFKLQSCDTDYTPTPANVVITGEGSPGIVQPPLESIAPTTKLSSLGSDDIIILCAVLFAVLFGFSSGVSAGKGIVR